MDMSATITQAPSSASTETRTTLTRLREYFWSDNARAVQTMLGLLWCLDGGLQFQSFMYSRGFVQSLTDGAVGQPAWLHDSIIWGANIANGNLTLWNTLFALVQCLLGIGLLYRPLVKGTLVASFVWVAIVWWFGEAFGMLFMSMAQPMTGAPGCIGYALVGLLAWPNGRPGGLLGPRGARIMWASLWLVLAYLWLLAPSSAANAPSSVLLTNISGIGPLNSLSHSIASGIEGGGLVIALIFMALSAAIAIAVAGGWRARFWLYLSIALNLIIWVIPEGLGGMFGGGATDPNSGPWLMLMAFAMLPVISLSSSKDRV